MKPEGNVQLESMGDRWEVSLIPALGKPFLLSESVLDELESCFRKISRHMDSREGRAGVSNGSPRIVVLKSQNPRYFCVGADIRILEGLNGKTIGRWVTRGHEVLNLIEDCPLPVVAKVQGYALGGGLELAMACDLIYADSTAKLGQTEAKIGMIPGWGGTLRLPERIGSSKAKRLLMTGEVLDAQSAKSMGLVDCLEASHDLDEAIGNLEKEVGQNSKVAISSFKKMLSEERKEARKRCLIAEMYHSKICIEDADTKERIAAFVRPQSKSV